MALTPEQEAKAVRLLDNLTNNEIDALSLNSNERRMDEIKANLETKFAAVQAALNTLYNSVRVLKVAFLSRDASTIASAKAQYQTDVTAYKDALQAARAAA